MAGVTAYGECDCLWGADWLWSGTYIKWLYRKIMPHCIGHR